MPILHKSVMFFFSLALFSCTFISYVEAVTPNTSLFFDVINNKVNKGDEVVVGIRVDASDQSINAVSGSFKIPTKSFTLESIETNASIIDFWVHEPKVADDTISFEGVALKKPYQGANGLIFTIKGIAVVKGTLTFNFNEGSILANDGLGTNVLGSLKSVLIAVRDTMPVVDTTKSTLAVNEKTSKRTQEIKSTNSLASTVVATENQAVSQTPPIILPVITNVPAPIDPSQSFYLAGKGTPNVLTQIKFQDISDPSIGRKIVRSLRTDRISYVSPKNLVAGVYNAVPEYIGLTKTENLIGTGVKIFITENTLSRILIIIINVLILIIPILALVLIIIFLPWYFKKEAHIIGKRMELEEEKIDAEEKMLEEQKHPHKHI